MFFYDSKVSKSFARKLRNCKVASLTLQTLREYKSELYKCDCIYLKRLRNTWIPHCVCDIKRCDNDKALDIHKHVSLSGINVSLHACWHEEWWDKGARDQSFAEHTNFLDFHEKILHSIHSMWLIWWCWTFHAMHTNFSLI